MVKVKRVRTIDAVVVGYRPGKEPDTVGSLILGLYDADGKLHVVGPLLRPARRREARAGRAARALRDRRARPRRPEPLEERAGARVDRAAPRARRRGHLRPRQRRAHPPRHEDPALARRQAAARVRARADAVLTVAELVPLPAGRRLGCTRLGSPALLGEVRRPRRVAEAALARRGGRARAAPSSEPACASMSALGSPRSATRAGTVSIRSSAGSTSATSSQSQRRRDARVGRRAHAVGRGDGAVARVLVVVDEHAVALLLPPLAGREPGHAPLDLARQRDARRGGPRRSRARDGSGR